MSRSRWLGFALSLLLALGLVVVAPPAASADPLDACTGSLAGQSLCDAAGVAPSAGGAVVQAGVAAVSFVTDPLGYVAAALSGLATWLMGQIAQVISSATQPDLSAGWWVDSYQKAMAVSFVLFCFVLLYELVKWAAGRVTPRQMGETLQLWVPAFLGGVLFGPALAQFMINGSGALADGIIKSLPGFGGGDAFKAIAAAVGNTGIAANVATGGIQGGGQAVLAIFEAIIVLIAAVVVFFVLCLQAAIVYLAAAVFPVTWVWIVSHRHRDHAWKTPLLIGSIIFGKALLFFALGVAMAIATSAIAIQGDGLLGDFALIFIGSIAMLLAAFAPWWLVKLLSVVPGGAGSGGTADGATSAAGGAARSAGRTGRGAVKGGAYAASAGGGLAALASRSRSGGTGEGNVIGGASAGWTKQPAQGATAKAASANASGSSGSSAGGAAPRTQAGAAPDAQAGAGSTTAPGGSAAAPAPTGGSGGQVSIPSPSPRNTAPAPRSPAGRMGRPSGPKPPPTGRGGARAAAGAAPATGAAVASTRSTGSSSGSGPKLSAQANRRPVPVAQHQQVPDAAYRLPTQPPVEET